MRVSVEPSMEISRGTVGARVSKSSVGICPQFAVGANLTQQRWEDGDSASPAASRLRRARDEARQKSYLRIRGRIRVGSNIMRMKLSDPSVETALSVSSSRQAATMRAAPSLPGENPPFAVDDEGRMRLVVVDDARKRLANTLFLNVPAVFRVERRIARAVEQFVAPLEWMSKASQRRTIMPRPGFARPGRRSSGVAARRLRRERKGQLALFVPPPRHSLRRTPKRVGGAASRLWRLAIASFMQRAVGGGNDLQVIATLSWI